MNKSSYMLAVLLIANPFMLLFFQNCSKTPTAFASHAPVEEKQQKSQSRGIASDSPAPVLKVVPGAPRPE